MECGPLVARRAAAAPRLLRSRRQPQSDRYCTAAGTAVTLAASQLVWLWLRDILQSLSTPGIALEKVSPSKARVVRLPDDKTSMK